MDSPKTVTGEPSYFFNVYTVSVDECLSGGAICDRVSDDWPEDASVGSNFVLVGALKLFGCKPYYFARTLICGVKGRSFDARRVNSIASNDLMSFRIVCYSLFIGNSKLSSCLI